MIANIDRLRRLSILLDEALDLDPPSLARWLEGLGQDDVALRPTLQSMLQRRGGAETADLLSRGPMLTSLAAIDEAGAAFATGDRIGPYRLDRPIGEGGMGEVWLAVRDDGLLKRRVAVKLPTLGARRSVLIERFARERDILSSLAHPNIARLYDAGQTADGQPYLALEFVEGEPITVHCARLKLGLRERVEVLRQVMSAVQYAHANLVVHRDLKPSNVLVTAAGQAMLLDFGIAKLLEEDQAESGETELTRQGGRAMTLHYAAPEQVSGAPVSIGTDVWALGILLYELVADRRPFSGKARDVERAILQDEPARPEGVPTDIYLIAAKALKKNPQERYATVDSMAEDLRRWSAGEPVLARPDRALYRLRKFAQRHRLGVAAGAALVVVIVAAAAISLWQAHEAREQALLARSEAATAEAVQQFLQEVLLANSSHHSDPAAARKRTVSEAMQESAARIDGALQDEPRAKLRVLRILSNLYGNMDDAASQVATEEKRVALAQKFFPGPTPERAETLMGLSSALLMRGREAESMALLEQAKAVVEQNTSVDEEMLASVLASLVSIQAHREDPGGLPAARRLVELAKVMRPLSRDLVRSLHMRGSLERAAGLYPEAVRSQQEALALEQKVPGGAAGGLSSMHSELARGQAALGDLEAAEASQRKALALAEANQGALSSGALLNLQALAGLLTACGRPAEALVLLEDARARLVKLGNKVPFDGVQSFALAMLDAQLAMGRPEAALQALAIVGAPTEPTGVSALAVRLAASEARARVQVGQLPEARKLLRDARVQLAEAAVKDRNAGRALADAEISLALADGKPAEAVAIWRQAEALHASGSGIEAEIALAVGDVAKAGVLAERDTRAMASRPRALNDSYARFRTQLTWARVHLRQSRPAAALPLLTRALTWNASAADSLSSPDRLLALMELMRTHAALGNALEAEAARREAEDIRGRHPQLGPQYAPGSVTP